jgi:hypothetical protein
MLCIVQNSICSYYLDRVNNIPQLVCLIYLIEGNLRSGNLYLSPEEH